jgi:hypothetical protein
MGVANVLKIYRTAFKDPLVSGVDERDLNYNDTIDTSDMYIFLEKYKLLLLLESTALGEKDKLQAIYNSGLFDNANAITGANLTRGLDWE